MAINPDNITTIRVDQLANLGVTLESLFPHTVGTELTSSPISDLVTLVANAIETTEALGFLPISVTDGQQLPDIPATPGFFLAGAGTYLNVNGFPDLVCTENLNVIMTVDDHWEIAVQIAVNPLTGSVQSVTGSAVDNTDPLNPVINLSSAVTSVNGLTGAVVLDGDNIDVTDPTTSTDGTLNDALANIYASGGTPDLQEVTNAGATTTNTIEIDVDEIETIIFKSNGNIVGSILANSEGAIYSTEDGLGGSSALQLGNLKNGATLYPLPTGVSSQIATLDDIPTLDATPTNGSTNGVESNGVFDSLALKVNASRFVFQGKTSITGTSTESNICSFKIDGGAYASTDGFKFDFTQYKGTTAGGITYRAYIGTTSGARTNQILSSAIPGANRTGDVTRRYYIDGGNLDCAVPFTNNAQSGLSTFGSVNTPISVNMTNDLWITITAQGQTSGETVGILGASITPLK